MTRRCAPTATCSATGPTVDVAATPGRHQGAARAQLAPLRDELRRYDAHMRDARGLAIGTRERSPGDGEPTAAAKFAGRDVAIGELQPEDVRGFIATELTRVSSASHAIALAAALRAYFRYRATCGDAVQPLLGVISSPAHWSLASLPRALKPEEVDRLLSSFTDALPLATARLRRRAPGTGPGAAQRRDHPAAAGRHRLAHGHRHAEAHEVTPAGHPAAAGYHRPSAGGLPATRAARRARDRALFVRHLAPHDKPIGVDAVRSVIGNALRARHPAWPTPRAAPHAGVPSGQQGSSIKEVADVLRHRSLNTSLIYAKLDCSCSGRGRTALARERGMSAPSVAATSGQGRAVPGRAAASGVQARTWAMPGPFRPLRHRGRPRWTADGGSDGGLGTSGPAEDIVAAGNRATSARRLRLLRPFTRWLQQFEPATEVPDEAIFGPIPGRVTPHIYREAGDRRVARRCPSARAAGQPASRR